MRMTGFRRWAGLAALGAALVAAAPARNAAGDGRVADSPAEVAGWPDLCGAAAGALGRDPELRPDPEYYRFPLVTTRRVPGTGNASGVGEVAFSQSPYGISLGPDGSYLYDFRLRFDRLAPARDGVYAVWTTTPELDEIALAGRLTDSAAFSGQVAWNKFLVVVTLESAFDPDATMWTGPIVIRGMSRSGMMHTMAGHGPFEEKNCAAYGY